MNLGEDVYRLGGAREFEVERLKKDHGCDQAQHPADDDDGGGHRLLRILTLCDCSRIHVRSYFPYFSTRPGQLPSAFVRLPCVSLLNVSRTSSSYCKRRRPSTI